MKQTILSILFLGGLTALCQAQAPIITSANNYVIGDRQITLTADTTGIKEGKAGANQTWDFSKIKPDSANDSTITDYVDPAKTTYKSDFPTANIVGVDPQNTNFTYFNMGSNQVEVLGEVSYDSTTQTATKVPFSNTLIFFKYPFTLGSTYKDDYSANITITGIKVYYKGNYSQTGDAYGTLKIRSTTYNNVLRIKGINISKDSVNIPSFGSSVTYDTSITYTFYTPGKKSPILTITYDKQKQDTNPTTTSKNIEFNDFDHVHTSGIIGWEPIINDISIFPNPTQGRAKIDINSQTDGHSMITIMNTMGQVVKAYYNYHLHTGQNVIDLEMNGMTKGIYFVKINSPGNPIIKKIILD